MARISTYPIDSNVSGGDMLIGTDVDNANATKNFTVSNLISYAATNNLVPYTGATQDVNLGSNDLFVGGTLGVTGLSTLNDVDVNGDIDFNGLFSLSGNQGAAGDFLTSTGAGNPPIWTNPLSGYVPYIGATASVNLGVHDLSCNGIDIGTGFFYTNGSAGTAGDLLVSGGIGNPVTWSNPLTGYVPYTGATTDVDLGTYKLSATGVDVKTGPLFANGSAGTVNQILTSQGAGTNPTWQTPPYVYAEYASFYSTQTQITSPTDPPAAMTYNNTDIASPSITIVNDGLGNPNQITFANAGVYNIQFSAQIEKTGGTDHQVYIWLRKNGVDISNTNTNLTLKGNANYLVAAWNFFVSVTAGQYVEIMWFHTGSVSLKYEAANGSIPCPATPSVILTVNKVSTI